MCSDLFCLLVDLWKSMKCCSMEDGAYVPFMVFMEGNK
jgi:hypothetical protein